ncbi:MAG: 3'-5' exonuclease, partial [Actinomycetota bacterium]
LSVTPTEPEESAEIARWIAERWAPGRSAAVLCRARKQFPQVLRALRERGLAATVVGLGGLLHTPEVVDLRSALQVAHDAARGDALMRLLTNERIGLTDLRVLADWAGVLGGRDGESEETATIVEAVDHLPPPGWANADELALSDEGRRRVERLRGVLRGIRADLSLPLLDIVAAAEQRLGLDIEVAARAGEDPIAARANLDAFAGHAASWAAGALSPTLGGFLAWLDAAEANENGLDIEEVDVSTDAVQVLTIHAAKGLEWDVVAVAGLSDSLFPSYRRNPSGAPTTTDGGWVTRAEEFPFPLRGDAAALPVLQTDAATCAEFSAELEDFKHRNFEHQLAEERRLAYVAVTRARSHLLLSASRFLPGVVRPATLSRFLADVAGIAAPPAGFAVAPEPGPDATNPELDEVRTAEYPTVDPAGGRRSRIEAAARAVRDAGERLERHDRLDGQLGHALDPIAVAAGPGPYSPGVAELVDEARRLLAERAEAGRAPVVHLGSHLSASAAIVLTASPTDFARRLRRPVPFRPQPRARVGSEFHAWVEHHFEQPALLHPDEGREAEEGTADLATLRANFLASPWAARRPLAVEVDLETLVAGRVIRCRLDAVFAAGDRFEVVDWKTGRRPGTRTELDIRQMQLALYRLAWSRATGTPLDRVTAAFFHVAEGVTVRADQWTEARIEERFASAFAAVGS